MAVVEEPAQSTWFETVLTVGVGLTVMVNVIAGPGQPPPLALTLIVAVMGAFVEFVAVYAPMFPVPLVPKPTSAVLVQLNVVLPTALEKLIAGADAALQ